MSENKKIKILYVVNARIPNERAHGIQIVHTCQALSDSGVDVTLVTPMFTGVHTPLKEHYGITETFQHRKIFALDIPKLPMRYVLRNISFFISINVYLICAFFHAVFTQRKLIVYVRGEVILALTPLTFFFPIFFETHQIRNYARWYAHALRRVSGIVVVTDKLKEKFVSEGIRAEKIIVARDAVDLQNFSNIHRDKAIWSRSGIPKEKKVVLYSGTLSEEKGVHTLAQAVQYLPEQVQVVFLGGTKKQVDAFRVLYGDIPAISILGRVEYTAVPAYIASADVLVIPDLSSHIFNNLYTSPMKLFEYMASGRPIVASRVSSLEEVLTDGTAFFFESGDAKLLAESILRVLEDEATSSAVGLRAKKVVEAFTWERRAQNIYTRILSCLGIRTERVK